MQTYCFFFILWVCKIYLQQLNNVFSYATTWKLVISPSSMVLTIYALFSIPSIWWRLLGISFHQANIPKIVEVPSKRFHVNFCRLNINDTWRLTLSMKTSRKILGIMKQSSYPILECNKFCMTSTLRLFLLSYANHSSKFYSC